MFYSMLKYRRSLYSACVGVLLLGLGTPAVAQIKMGFVNVPKVMDQAPQAKAADNRLEKEFGPRDSEILAMKRDVVKSTDKLAKNSAVMSVAERQRQESEVRQMRREIRRLEDEFREDVNLRRSQELGKLQRKVVAVIQALAKAEKFDLIISDGVIYAGSKVDITAKVINRLKQSK
ncbi:MAG: outer membrane protein [Gammaproteobacteria bacterium]|jgi:outer membrane protein